MRRPKCPWTGRGRYRPVRCARVAAVVIFAAKGCAIRCRTHADAALEILKRAGTKHATCPLPAPVRS